MTVPEKRLIRGVIWSLLILAGSVFTSSPAFALLQGSEESSKDQTQLLSEESTNYYKKWLDEDVVYIITSEERSIFEDLTTSEEKDSFIEQFWHRRDPDLTTSVNERKEEHYRRIAYANENFTSGFAGWKTDRGRIYIIHGPPDQKESYPTGGNYQREAHEGGGFTNVYPFERWWYRYLEGVGSDIEMEFVDPRMSNEYYLAVNPEEKDALLHVPGGGPTLAEDLGYLDKKDRPYFVSNYGDPYPGMNNRAKDDPMRRYERFFEVQRPTPIKYRDLKQLVEVNVTYDQLPFEVRRDYFRITDAQILAPVTIQLDMSEFSLKPSGSSLAASIVVYGLVSSLTGHIVEEFEDVLTVSFTQEELSSGQNLKSLYQKIVPLKSGMRYKLDLVVKDLNSGKIGNQRHAMIPPRFGDGKLETSSLLLSGYIRELENVPDGAQMFVLGDIKIRPSVDGEFISGDPLGIYLQIYNAQLDQTTLKPSLSLTYKILKNGEPVRMVQEADGESVYFFSGQRAILVRGLPLEGLEAGDYELQVLAEDRIGDQKVMASSSFEVIPKPKNIE